MDHGTPFSDPSTKMSLGVNGSVYGCVIMALATCLGYIPCFCLSVGIGPRHPCDPRKDNAQLERLSMTQSVQMVKNVIS